jgi:hypothetical protein
MTERDTPIDWENLMRLVHREPTPEQERRYFEMQRAVAERVIAHFRAKTSEYHDPGDEDRR